MKNIIFLGGLFPAELKNEIEKKSKGVIQYAANALQWNIVEGLDFYIKGLKIINLIYIGSYPARYRSLKIRTSIFSHKKGSNDINVGFLNLTGYKTFSRYYNAKRILRKHLRNGNEIIVIYAIQISLVMAVVHLKKRNPNIKICLIVSDLPEFTNDKKDTLFKVLKRIERNMLNKALEKIDAFVLLSDAMAKPLSVGDRPWVRIEGIFNPKDIVNDVKKEQYKTILYSGTLAKRYGILNLLDAFSMIKNQDYRLWICGDGDARDEIKERTDHDFRITNFSQIPREKVLELQKKATVLVNPRTSQGAFTKYSFPSKTMEYLASGTPCIIHRLEGIPKEYLEYCFISYDETPLGLFKTIIFVCEKDPEELEKFGAKARKFIMEQKTPLKQSEKIFDMLKCL
jgi:glycosyltransferase involved in cell wall biosynthesis